MIFKAVALLFTPLFLFAFELSVDSGKEDNTPFSIIHIKDKDKFLCESIRNDFDQTTQIVCVFAQRPSQNLKPISNTFFDISFTTKGSNYFIKIKPLFKMKLYPMIFDLKSTESIFDADIKLASHWSIVGYKDKMPFVKEENLPATAINFPISVRETELPYVGSLDLQGKPVRISKIKDVSDYLAIKRYYKAKDYESTLSLIDDVLREYPDTVFKSELLLYKIRSSHFLNDNETLLEDAKLFLHDYASDDNIPEVLAYTAKAYSDMGLYSDSDYFFERLFDEHENSKFAHLGMIFKADQLDASGDSKKALSYYKRALYTASDIDIASIAAFKMSAYYLDHNKAKEAEVYTNKILDANSDYFAKNLDESLKMALDYSDHLAYEPAARILAAIYNKYPSSAEQDEEILKNEGIWLAKAGKKEEALSVFNQYLNHYKYGEYVETVQEEKDALFFEKRDENLSTKLKNYDTLIQTYPNDSIGNKALYKKAKLLCDNGKYQETLDLQEPLKALDPTVYTDVKSLINEAAQGLMQEALKAKQCKEVIALSETYEITLSSKWDKDIFECAFMGGNFGLAKATATPHLKERNLDERMGWLFRYIKTDFATGNYSEVVREAKELLSLAKMEKNSQYNEVKRILFDAYQRLGDEDGMLEMISEIEKSYGLVYEDSERYTQMLALAQNKKDDQMSVNYAKKVMQLQEKANAYTQTPYIEFTLAQALINLSQESDALEVMKSLNNKKLTKAQRARQQYQLGSLYQKAGKKTEALAAYKASMKADESSAWAKLSKDSISLVK